MLLSVNFKIVTNAIYLNRDKSKIESTSKTDNIDFSDYANFLINNKKIDIGFKEDKYKEQLFKKASRKYVAKILTEILEKKGFTKKINCDRTDGDWDKCSDFLNSKCIVQGKNGKFLPNDNIHRDEVSVWIVQTMDFLENKNLTCTDRFGKDVK